MSLINLKSIYRQIQDEVPAINSGGCSIAALAVLRYCKNKHPLMLPYLSFILEYSDEHDYESAEKLIEDGKIGCTFTPDHVFINTPETGIDSNGIYNQDEDLFYIEIFTESQLLVLVNNMSWNDAFDRETFVPIIASITNTDLSDIKL